MGRSDFSITSNGGWSQRTISFGTQSFEGVRRHFLTLSRACVRVPRTSVAGSRRPLPEQDAASPEGSLFSYKLVRVSVQWKKFIQ
jgi:hypothetical protein